MIIEYQKSPTSPLSDNEIHYAVEYIKTSSAVSEYIDSSKKIIIPGISYEQSLKYYDTNSHLSCEMHECSKYRFMHGRNIKLASIDSSGKLDVIDNILYLDFDLVYLVYFSLNRLEEVNAGSNELDNHGRFISEKCLFVRHGLHHFPVIDNWMVFLHCFSNDYEGPIAEENVPVFDFSMDVDHLDPCFSYINVLKNIYRDLRYQKINFPAFFYNFFNNFKTTFNSNLSALLNFVDFLDCHSIKGTFFFMAADQSEYDSGYVYSKSQHNDAIGALIRGGHKVGWHPGYYAGNSRKTFAAEFLVFESRYGFKPKYVRHHYLRWSPELSWTLMEELGILEDHSVGFASTVGFKAGTSKPYHPFNERTQSLYRLEVHPLVMMDDVVFSYNASWLNKIRALLLEARKTCSPATFLIHNSRLLSSRNGCLEFMNKIKDLL